MNVPISRRVALLLSLAACAESRSNRDPMPLEPPPAEAGAPDVDASEPWVAIDVMPEICGGEPFGPEWKVRRTSQCRSSADCVRGHCIGVPESVCEYGEGRTMVETGPCASDEDCSAGRNGRCANYLYASCRYDFCQVDADCSEGSHCICPARQRYYQCIVEGCIDDSNCPDASCREDLTLLVDSGAAPSKHCTTVRDECQSASDCEAPEGCGFDVASMRWTCRESVFVGPTP